MPIVHDVADVLEELPVEVMRNRRVGFGRIDGRSDTLGPYRERRGRAQKRGEPGGNRCSSKGGELAADSHGG